MTCLFWIKIRRLSAIGGEWRFRWENMDLNPGRRLVTHRRPPLADQLWCLLTLFPMKGSRYMWLTKANTLSGVLSQWHKTHGAFAKFSRIIYA